MRKLLLLLIAVATITTYPYTFHDVRNVFYGVSGYELIGDIGKSQTRGLHDSKENLEHIQNSFAHVDYEHAKNRFIQNMAERYAHDPDETLKQLYIITNQELSTLSCLLQQIQIYLSQQLYADAPSDETTFHLMSVLSEIQHKVQNAIYSIPSPATHDALIEAGCTINTYCDIINDIIAGNCKRIPTMPHTPDTSGIPRDTSHTAHILVNNAFRLSQLEPLIQNINLTWYNKAYRTMCNAADQLPKGLFSWTSAGIAVGASLIALYHMPKQYAEQIGVRNIQKKIFGPYFDPEDDLDKQHIAQLHSQLEKGYPSQPFNPPQQSLGIISHSRPYRHIPASSIYQPYYDAIKENATVQASRHFDLPTQEFNARYTQPYSWLLMGATAWGIVKEMTNQLYEPTQVFRALQDINSMLGGVYTRISQKLSNVHNRLKGEAPEQVSKFQYVDDITLDDPRFDAIRNSLQPLQNILDYMNNPYKFTHGGYCISHNILIKGKSGTGKSFVARAFAGSLNQQLHGKACFWNLDQADWKNLNTMGLPDAVQAIIDVAKQYAPCVIFIDEIHTYLAKRDGETTFLNQLLKALDETDLNQNPDEQVFIIGATNHTEDLDQALLRDARFGERIEIPMPNFEQRKTILQTRCDQMGIDTTLINFDYLASITHDCPLSTLEKTFEQATFLARRDNMPVTLVHFYKAINKVARKIDPVMSLSDSEKEIIATNIASQSIIEHLHNPNSIDALTICYIDMSKEDPHAIEYGNIFYHATHEMFASYDTSSLRKRCKQLIAGKIGEEMVQGHRSTYRSDDMTQAYRQALDIACNGVPFAELSESMQNSKREEAYKIFMQLQDEARSEIRSYYHKLEQLRNTLVREYFVHHSVLHSILEDEERGVA